jgi:hypothetical protein
MRDRFCRIGTTFAVLFLSACGSWGGPDRDFGVQADARRNPWVTDPLAAIRSGSHIGRSWSSDGRLYGHSPVVGSTLLVPAGTKQAIEAKLDALSAKAAAANPPYHFKYGINHLWMSPKGTNWVYFDGTYNHAEPKPGYEPVVGFYNPTNGYVYAYGPRTSHEGLNEPK